MTPASQTALEGNRLIADFMELECDVNPFSYPLFQKDRKSYYAEELEYHTSWDWQVPAWSKATFEIRKIAYGDNGKTDFYLHLLDEYEQCVFQNNPKRGCEVLIKAIEWYNTNKHLT